jgi:hypothetical protein
MTVRKRGVGCGGRGSVGRVSRSQGGFSVSDPASAQDERCFNAFARLSIGGTHG